MKNERGERILDTLIKADEPGLQIGAKAKLVHEFGILRAPSLETVQRYLIEIFKERTVVGYHIDMKLGDIGIYDQLKSATLHDCAKMFNPNPLSGQQWQMRQLCSDFLNLSFKKPSSSYAVSFEQF